MELCTDGPATFEGRSAMDVVGYEMTKTCADRVFKEAGYADGQGRDLVGVVELHDCFAANEVCLRPSTVRNWIVETISSSHIPPWDFADRTKPTD
jgi:hypothetical protein